MTIRLLSLSFSLYLYNSYMAVLLGRHKKTSELMVMPLYIASSGQQKDILEMVA